MRRLTWLADTYLSVASPIQHALPSLLDHAASFRAPLIGRLKQNLERLRVALAGSAASVLRAEGGWYAVVRLPNLASEEDWVLGLLKHGGVMVHPGHFYDFAGRVPHLVVSLLAPEESFGRGAERLRAEIERRVAGL
jgi:aspartate/methionine/tyrosine aminotransferase